MQFQFSFKHMDSSSSLESYSEAKISEKIAKFVTKPIEAHLFFSVTKHEHHVHLHFKAGDGFTTDVESRSGDMYSSIDIMSEKFEAQLKKHKEKLKSHKASKSLVRLVDGYYEGEGNEAEAVDAGDIIKYEMARKRASR